MDGGGEENLRLGCASSAQGFLHVSVGFFQRVGDQFGQQANGAASQRERTGDRTQTGDDHEDDGQNQLRDTADNHDEHAEEAVHPLVSHHVGGSHDANRDGEDSAEEGGGEGDLQGIEKQLENLAGNTAGGRRQEQRHGLWQVGQAEEEV